MNSEKLKEAISLSLFTNKGWWGDAINAFPIGSNLHKLERVSDRHLLTQQSKDYSKDALKWMIERGFCDDISVKSELINGKSIIIIDVTKNNKSERIIIDGQYDFTYP